MPLSPLSQGGSGASSEADIKCIGIANENTAQSNSGSLHSKRHGHFARLAVCAGWEERTLCWEGGSCFGEGEEAVPADWGMALK